jgi:RNA polymerase sigma-70 factor (ECF subfamily)
MAAMPAASAAVATRIIGGLPRARYASRHSTFKPRGREASFFPGPAGGRILLPAAGNKQESPPVAGRWRLDNAAEAELLSKASQGDEAAFLQLYERHRTPVFRFAARLLGSTSLAEDVTQECFLSLIRRPATYQPERASLRTYLCAAARHLAFRHLRRQGLEVDAEAAPEPAAPAGPAEPLQRLIDAEVSDVVRQAVSSLPPLQREAVVLFEYEEMNLADVAAVAGCDVGTVKSRLHRARERLRRTLAPWLAAAPPCKEARP